ncbi:2-hydroxychromene-2-carboxylate isomerase [Alphaproteobacteria bacterium SO-S41]|nr:2-hydroxychromene-2-carboxylate isomerase [Alphaproteobacteria bacterium SO-S41]
MVAGVEFWFEFASTYSYLAAARIEALARSRDVAVAWRPFLLGPIFSAQGWTTSPFNIYEAKGRNMWRDMERLAQLYGLPFAKPSVFPQNGLKAARLALALPDGPRRAAFVKAVYAANFAHDEPIAEDAVLDGILHGLGEDVAALHAVAATPEIKDALRTNTATAIAKGVFGAPAVICADGELFWGNDRLEHALDWAARLDQGESSA